MTRVSSFARFCWEFIAGDDWRIAAGLAVALAVSALLVRESVAAWWLLPIAVIALLTRSLHRAIRADMRGRVRPRSWSARVMRRV